MIKSISLEQGAKLLLVQLYIFGAIGMLSPFKDFFLPLTPLNLLFTLVVLLYYHPTKNAKFYTVAGVIMFLGYLIEVIGVNTGYPFGDYKYGSPLGIKMMGTPFMIGVNWFVLTYCGAMLFRKVSKSKFLNSLMAGVGITLLDFIMEPVAIHLDFWSWSENHVPIQNYITWGVCISIFSLLIYKVDEGKRNPLSHWILALQVIFFLILLIGINI